MQIVKKELAPNQIELTITVEPIDMQPYLQNAAQKLSHKNPLPGFRPGKAPYELIKQRWGEMAILEAALDEIINLTFFKAVEQEKLTTVGRPDVKIEKVAPGNPLVYVASIYLLPSVSLGEWQSLQIKKNEIEVSDDDVSKTLKQLQEINTEEKLTLRPAKAGDKVELDFTVMLNKVVIEGGQHYKYPVYIGRGQMIPGFEDQLVGLSAGQEKKFQLKFPEKYPQANLAGNLADFQVKMINVYELSTPELNDDLAKKIGFADSASLHEQIKHNIMQDKREKEERRVEAEALAAVAKNAVISAIPPAIIDQEIHKMIHELEHSLNNQGMDLSGYLKSINKTHDDLHHDFHHQAEERIKAFLILREIAKSENISLEKETLEQRLNYEEKMYRQYGELPPDFKTPAYRQEVATIMLNQKVIKFIAEKIIK